MQAATVNAGNTPGLIVGSDSSEQRFRITVNGTATGTVTDRTTGQPLADAEVTLLQAQDVESGASADLAFIVHDTAQRTDSNGTLQL
ncbi:MAG: hypothetical protein R2867_44165 [Caldilineaceae bacterium]